MKAKIWCEVTCLYCGRSVGWSYVNAKSISNLKKATSEWSFDPDVGNLCPDCYAKFKENGRKGLEKYAQV